MLLKEEIECHFFPCGCWIWFYVVCFYAFFHKWHTLNSSKEITYETWCNHPPSHISYFLKFTLIKISPPPPSLIIDFYMWKWNSIHVFFSSFLYFTQHNFIHTPGFFSYLIFQSIYTNIKSINKNAINLNFLSCKRKKSWNQQKKNIHTALMLSLRYMLCMKYVGKS